MALLELPATAPAPAPAAAPRLGQVVRRVGSSLLIACVVPGVVFYSLFVTVGIWPAIAGGLCWSYGAIIVRRLTGRRTSGMLLLTAGVLTLRTLVALAAQSTFIYFLQPVLTDLAIGLVFLLSALTARPLVARLAGDFYPLTDELHARPRIQRLLRRLTVLWAVVLLTKAVVVFALLKSQPLTTFVLAKGIVVPVANATTIALTILAAAAVARHEGLLEPRPAILPG
jgi:hypothetical protein